MKAELTTFRVFPSVIKADRESEISVFASGGIFTFFDDIEYEVRVIPTDYSDIPEDESLTIFGLDEKRPMLKIKPQGGVLKFKYFFSGEQEWHIKISTKEYHAHEPLQYKDAAPHWNWVRERPEKGVILSVYSLLPDLYERTPLRCDLHVHTNQSDGDESPLLTAAAYRRAGYDAIALTDHAQYNIASLTKEKMDFKTDYKVLVAEEIHNAYNGQLHIICLGADTSISNMFIKEPKRVEKEVGELEKSVKIPPNVPKKEYLYRLWAYKTAKMHGGFVIYPHPYWNIGKCRWQVGPNLAMAILKNGLCDAFEIMGGGNTAENNLQACLYYEAVKEGVNLPLVGSTDNHSVMGEFDTASSIIFAKGGDVIGAVASSYSVAAEHKHFEMTRFYGPYRLARYARFLVDYYFPIHRELCASAGQVMVDYVLGHTNDSTLLEALEERVKDFENKFFGRA